MTSWASAINHSSSASRQARRDGETHAVPFTPRRAPLTLSVGGICGVISRRQMIGVDAMASASTWALVEQIRYGTLPGGELPGNAVGCLRFGRELSATKQAVSVSIEVSGPQPTLPGLVHSRPKRILPGVHQRGCIARMNTEPPRVLPGHDLSHKELGAALLANSLNFSHEEIIP